MALPDMVDARYIDHGNNVAGLVRWVAPEDKQTGRVASTAACYPARLWHLR
ncbi:MAG: hypothetical protein II038_10925 [Lachnospiraceae bacterium]|nr:hypothetical protein [Lachnospiraceae bacterium]